jgi:hypothetical protein
MERRKKLREQESERQVMMPLSRRAQTFTNSANNTLTNVVEDSYTTSIKRNFSGELAVVAGQASFANSVGLRRAAGNKMAFVRRKGNAYYLVHNVRRDGKVQQLHLAKLGERARITDEVVREVNKKHPFVDLNWRELRAQLDSQINLADPQSPAVQNLVHSLRSLNLDLADLIPPVVRFSESPAVARELLVQLRLLHSTIQVKLNQFARKDELKRMHRSGGRFGNAWRDQ